MLHIYIKKGIPDSLADSIIVNTLIPYSLSLNFKIIFFYLDNLHNLYKNSYKSQTANTTKSVSLIIKKYMWYYITLTHLEVVQE